MKISDKVSVVAPARLHLGFMDLNGSLGRKFGSVGMAIDSIETDIIVSKIPLANRSDVSKNNKRAHEYAQLILKAYELEESVSIKINKSIPEHSGLGSGTQLALAVGSAVSKLFNLNLSLMDIGKILDRGNRSGIGIGAFEHGGFLIDGGKGKSDDLPQITVRHNFPDNWRIVLLINQREKGLHGKKEFNAFKTLKPFPINKAEKLCHLVNMVILPSIVEKNFRDFACGIGTLQQIVGTHFAPIQGGVYSNPDIARIMKFVENKGFTGIGQSSWGPTGFILTDSDTSAHNLVREIRNNFLCKDLTIDIIKGRNTGSVFKTNYKKNEIKQTNKKINKE